MADGVRKKYGKYKSYCIFAITELATLPVRSAYQGESFAFIYCVARHPNVDILALGIKKYWESEPLWQI